MNNVNIVRPDDNFNFEELSLSNPTTLIGQTFFSKLTQNNKELFLLTPQCNLKNGFVTSSKHCYCDLVFTKEDENIIAFMENLETCIQKMIYARRDKWFHDNIEMDDIENIFTSPLKSYKSGKNFTLRAFTSSPRNILENKIKVYDEYDNEMSIDQINSENNIICILHVNGLKFSSKLFQIYFEVKQIVSMRHKENPFSNNIISVKKVESDPNSIDEYQDTGKQLQSNEEEKYREESRNKDINTDDEIIQQQDNNLSEIDVAFPENEETLTLKPYSTNNTLSKEEKLNYYYKAKEKAKAARINAINMIANVNNLKNTMMINEELNESSDDEISLSELNELSESDGEDASSYENEELQSEEQVSQKVDDIQLDIEDLNKLDKNDSVSREENYIDDIEGEYDNEEYNDDISISSEEICEQPERITIYY